MPGPRRELHFSGGLPFRRSSFSLRSRAMSSISALSFAASCSFAAWSHNSIHRSLVFPNIKESVTTQGSRLEHHESPISTQSRSLWRLDFRLFPRLRASEASLDEPLKPFVRLSYLRLLTVICQFHFPMLTVEFSYLIERKDRAIPFTTVCVLSFTLRIWR